jgi:hypothetical protein
MAAEMLTDYVDSVGICCFTDVPDSTQMWSYYAASHTGFCLGFDFPSRAADGSIGHNNIYKVTYAYEIPRFPISVYKKRPYPFYENANPILATKHKNWEHESEFRYIHTKANILAPFPRQSLKEVILGSRITGANRDALINECSAYENVALREAIVIPRTYPLKISDPNADSC